MMGPAPCLGHTRCCVLRREVMCSLPGSPAGPSLYFPSPIMIKRLVLGLAVAAVLTPARARAGTPGEYNFCGGSGFTFCASVNMSVVANATGGYTVTLEVANRSQASGTGAPAQCVSLEL